MSEERKKMESFRKKLKETNHGNKPGSSLVDKSRLTTSVGMSKEKKESFGRRLKETNRGNPMAVSDCSSKRNNTKSMLQTNRVNKPRTLLVAGTPPKDESRLAAATPVIPEPVVPKEQKPFFYWIEQWKKREKQRESENKNNVR